MLDREGHGHKAVVYKSHFLPLRHSVVTETPADTLANKPRLTKDQALCSLCPHDRNITNFAFQENTSGLNKKFFCLFNDLNWNLCFRFSFLSVWYIVAFTVERFVLFKLKEKSLIS